MKFSIVTPSFNHAHFIRETIDSIVSQEGNFDIELIVMDGGSKDDTVKILKEYEEKLAGNKRIDFKWVSEKDKGQSDAINKGLKVATGEIQAYLNSDDYYLPGALAAVAEALSKPNTYWLYGLCQIVDEKGKQMHGPVEKYRNALGKNYSYNKLLTVNFVAQPATFWKKELYDEFGGVKEDEHLVMDYEYWCRFGSKYPAVSLPVYVAAFRRYATSKSNAQTGQQFKEALDVASRFTKNPVVLGAHKLHDFLTVSVYRLIN